MKRRTLLAALSASAVAGCLADDSGTDDGSGDPLGTAVPPDSVAGQLGGEPTRPACTVESESIEVARGDETETYETAPTVPYPGAPSSLKTEAIYEYVEAFEHAYVTQDVLCDWAGSDHVLNVSYAVRRHETVERPDGVTVVALVRTGGATQGTDGEHFWVAELAPEGVAYAIDETGLARAEFDEPPGRTDDLESAAPDPLDAGELVAVFDGDYFGSAPAGPEDVAYDRCERTYVGVQFDLPDPAVAEATAAIEDGAYETADDPVLPQAMDVDTAYLTAYDADDVKRYYAVTVTTSDDRTRLQARETLPETDPVSIRNETGEDLTVEIRLEYAATMARDVDVETEGTVLVDDTVTVTADDAVALESTDGAGDEADDDAGASGDAVEYRYGNYRATVSAGDGEIEDELTWRMWDEYSSHGTIRIDADGEVSYRPGHYHPEGEQPSCEWDDDGDLIAGPGAS